MNQLRVNTPDTHGGQPAGRPLPLRPLGAKQPFRLALITAGQSPRPQIRADLAAALPDEIEISEFGALDTFTPSELEQLEVKPDEPTIATRLRSGDRILVPRRTSHMGIQSILSRMQPDEFDLAVIFCTGGFHSFPALISPCRLIQSQPALENAVRMLVVAGHRIGVIQPYERHVAEDNLIGLATYQRWITWLDTADESDWARVIAASADCEALVLNSVDYDEEAAVRLRRETNLPVILPRRVLASAIRMVLDTDQVPPVSSPADGSPQPPIDRLTSRERQVMWLMVEGLQSKQIGRQLQISPNTVNIHRASVLSKLGVASTNMLTRLMLGRN